MKNSKRRKRLIALIALILIAAMVVTTILASVVYVQAAESDSESVSGEDASGEADTDGIRLGLFSWLFGGNDEEEQTWEGQAVSAGLDENTRILDGIYIGEVNVGGMSISEARDAVNAYISGLSEKTVKLYDAGNSELCAEITAGELGFTWEEDATLQSAVEFGNIGNLVDRYKNVRDLEHQDQVFMLTLTPNSESVATVLSTYYGSLNKEPVDWGIAMGSDGLYITGGEDGLYVDSDKAYESISTYFKEGWKESAEIELATVVAEPGGSKEELESITDVLGSYSTDYSASIAGRKANVEIGCSKVSGTVVYPGESFSTYSAMGPITEENGYQMAYSYENGATVESVGGGICQVSTTLYNAVIRAELQIDVRYGHTMTVSYVDPSADASVSSTGWDLVFTNNLENPIYIYGYADGSTISFVIYGQEYREAGRSVSFESEVKNEEACVATFKAVDEDIGYMEKVQDGHDGMEATLYKIVYMNGEEVSREPFNYTTYKVTNSIYEVGTKSDYKKATRIVTEAIASCDNSEDMRNAIAEAEEVIAKKDAAKAEAAAAETTDTGDGVAVEDSTAVSGTDTQ